jgi:hypothetical protein
MTGTQFGEYVSLIPAAACVLGFLALYLRWPPFRPSLPLLIFFALAVRWVFLVQFSNPSGDVGFDTESYRLVGGLVRDGKDVYAETDRHPYLPLQMYLMALVSWLNDHWDPHFFSWIRWPNILADLGILVLIFRSSLKLGRGESVSFWLAFIWAVHPVSVYTSMIHAQFDSVPLFFAMASWYALRFHAGWGGAAAGGIALGLGVLDKTWPALFVAPLVVMAPTVRARVLFLALVGLVPLAFLGLYEAIIGTTTDLVELRVVDYNAVPDRYGFTYAFQNYLEGDVPSGWLPYFREHGRDILLASVVIVSALVVPRRDALSNCVTIIATFLVFTYGWGSQYLVWIVPLAILSQQRFMLGLYTVVATASLLTYYWGTCGYICPGRWSATNEYWEFQWVWPVAMLWLARDIVLALPLRETASAFWRGLRGTHSPAAAQ